ncbi:MAG: carbon starvation protein A [Candidatus Omnitrophica bacterium]|nr:carbon starvation protein A [Candidatus Omnitrophota bacterium]
MNVLTLVFAGLCIFAIGYRFYGLFIANKVLGLNSNHPTPAVKMADGHDYVKTDRYILFGHHFAAIAAAGPLMGPVLAAQFGYLPGALWILIGCVLAGAVHDMIVLFVSVRHKGHSLADIAGIEIDKSVGTMASFAILFILVLTLAGFSLSVVNALVESPWGTFVVFATMPIALIMGIYLHVWRPGDVKGVSILGGALLLAALIAGPHVAANPAIAKWFTFSKKELAVLIPVYGFIASVLPVWLVLCPRDYLSSYLKIGTITMLALGIVFVQPHLHMPAITKFVHGGGPIVPGSVFPFIFITIACGALSGFHAIIGTGTTPKMVGDERDVLFIGYGAMLVEGFVALMALIAACVLVPGDYFAINSSPEVFKALGMSTVNLDALSKSVGETLQGRTGGGVSLAVGMSYIFSSVPFMKGLMSYWYHYAIMFEALFILSAVDTGTRVGRFLMQEIAGRYIPRFKEKKWMPGILITGAVFTSFWGYLLYTGDISTIWPIFGISNQLLAACGLIVGTTVILRFNKAKYAWITAVPGIFMVFITGIATYRIIIDSYLPKKEYLLANFAAIIFLLMVVIFIRAFIRWAELLRIKTTTIDSFGQAVLTEVEE